LLIGFLRRKFELVLEKAKEACENSGQAAEDHFVHAAKMVSIGKIASGEYPG